MKRVRIIKRKSDFPVWFSWVFLTSTLVLNLCMAQVHDFHDLGSESLLSEQLRNVSVHIFYNHTIRRLQYLISWEDAPNIEHYTVDVAQDSTNTDCKSRLPNWERQVPQGTTELLVPNDEDEAFQLKGNCTYSINIAAETMPNYPHSKFKSIWDTIPLCVDGVCDCDILRPEPIITPRHLLENTFEVTWNFSSVGEVNDIKDMAFHVYNCSEETAVNAVEILPLELGNRSAKVNIDTKLEEFCLLVTFLNKYNCTYVAREAIGKRLYYVKSQSWIHITSTVILVSILLLVIAYWYIDKCRGTVKALIVSRIINRGINRHPANVYGVHMGRRQSVANLLYIEQEIVEGKTDNFEVPRNAIQKLDRIGNGAFGEVFLGTISLSGKDFFVAIKTLRDNAPPEEMQDFLAEIDIMKRIGNHPNIVTMHKCCTLQQPYMMIMEYLPFGDLKHYLVDLRNQWYRRRNVSQSFNHNSDGSASYISPESPLPPVTPSSIHSMKSCATQYSTVTVTPTSIANFSFDVERVLDHKELQNFALQIAKGMAHLEKIPITHRDLAARNILVNECKVLKISDFGLSRAGPYVNRSQKKLPLRWMALEAIEQHVYGNKSDVWSFAIVLWEIATLGAFPYGDVPDRMLLYNLQMGKRLPRPEICTDELYSIMLRCWSADPELRPSFEELVNLLDVKKTCVYVDFSQLNPMYVFPPISEEDPQPIPVVEKAQPTYLECQ